MRGRLIAIEGIDGAGKSTISEGLAVALGAELRTTPSTELRTVRDIVDACLANEPLAGRLFYAATVLEASAELDRMLGAGRDVVVDRYWLSTLAYSQAAGVPLHLPEVEARLVPADLTLFVVSEDAERARRLAARGMSPHDRETLQGDRSAALRGAYLSLRRHAVAGTFITLDTTHLSPAEAVREAERRVREALGRHRQLWLFPREAERRGVA